MNCWNYHSFFYIKFVAHYIAVCLPLPHTVLKTFSCKKCKICFVQYILESQDVTLCALGLLGLPFIVQHTTHFIKVWCYYHIIISKLSSHKNCDIYKKCIGFVRSAPTIHCLTQFIISLYVNNAVYDYIPPPPI